MTTEPEGPDSCVQYSEKGGVAKTDLTVGMAAVAAKRGLRVGVLDGDPRATATDALGVEVGPQTLTMNDLLYVPDDLDSEPVDPAEAVWDVLQPAGPGWPTNVRVIPAERKLVRRERDHLPFDDRLRRAVAALDGEFDLLLGDVAPSAGGRLLTAILRAMRKTVIPAPLNTDGYQGLQHSLHSLKVMQAGGGYAPQLVGAVRTMVPKDREIRAIHKSFDDALKENYGHLLLSTKIRMYAVREEARVAAIPITSAPGAEARVLEGMYGEVLDCILAAKPVAA